MSNINTIDYKNLPVLGAEKLPPLGKPMDVNLLASVSECLADNQLALKYLQEGAQMEYFRWPIDFTQGIVAYWGNNHLNGYPEINKIMKLEAIALCEQGETEGAINCVIDIFGIGKSLKQEPTLFSQVQRISAEANGLRTLQHVMNRVELNEKQLDSISETLDKVYDPKGIVRAYAGERCLGNLCFSHPDQFDKAFRISDSSIKSAFARGSGVVGMNHIAYLDLMEKLIQAQNLPYPNRLNKSLEIFESIKLHFWSNLLLEDIFPSLDLLAISEANLKAKTDSARTVVAIEKYRLVHNDLPNQLGDLIPVYINEIPKDPYDGKPIKYKISDPGYVVYSIGKDQQDDGGRNKYIDNKEQNTWDIVFRVIK